MQGNTLEGQTLGKYRLLEPLGRGGMAQVYRAYHPQLDRYVAIKVLRSDLVEEEEFLARFQREARSVAALRHPNIVQVYDADAQEGVYYFVMELLEGDTLKTRLNLYRARNERMAPAMIVHTLSEVLAGLGYAHSENIIHRDIKPANILLNRRGQAVLTDFGIAQIVGGTQYTISGALMGTLNYMAPEQGLENRCDMRSDLYSLGIVYYEMLTGKPPFDADTPLAILMKHLNDPLPLPRKLNPDIPESFERVALKALAKQPDDRYQSAEEMGRALQQAAVEAGATHLETSPLPAPGVIAANTFAGATILAAPTSQEATLPPEVIAVYSGAARKQLSELPQSNDDTDFRLEEQLKGRDENADLKTGSHPEQATQAPSGDQTILAAKTALHAAARAATQVVEKLEAQPWPQHARNASTWLMALPLPTVSAEKAILSGVAVLIGANLLAVYGTVAFSNEAIFGRGWPMELLLVSVLLSCLVIAGKTPWLIIPVGILLGNGIIFTYYSVTGLWGQWALCWPLEPILVMGSIFGANWLVRNGERFPGLGQRIGYLAILLAALSGGILGLGVMVASLLSVFS